MIIPVGGLMDAMRMRAIRNSVREFMTRDTSHISLVRQIQWFRRAYLPAARDGAARGYLLWLGSKAVGYGLIRRDRVWWVSGGLLPSARGQGLGRLLFKFLTAAAQARGRRAWLEVRENNTFAVELYRSLGYRLLRRRGNDVLVMATM